MGITDAPVQVNLTDIYPDGTPFLVESAWVEGVVKTQYGDRTMAKIIAKPCDGGGVATGQGQEFAVWGSLCEQVQQLEEGDLPAVLKVVKDGKRWLFKATGTAPAQPAAGAATPDESALGLTPGAGEGADVSAAQVEQAAQQVASGDVAGAQATLAGQGGHTAP